VIARVAVRQCKARACHSPRTARSGNNGCARCRALRQRPARPADGTEPSTQFPGSEDAHRRVARMEKWQRERPPTAWSASRRRRKRPRASSTLPLSWAQGSIEQPQHVDISVERRLRAVAIFRRSGAATQFGPGASNRRPTEFVSTGDRALRGANRQAVGRAALTATASQSGGRLSTISSMTASHDSIPALPSKTVQGRRPLSSSAAQLLGLAGPRPEGGCCSPGIRSAPSRTDQSLRAVHHSRRLPTSAPGPVAARPRGLRTDSDTAETRATPVSSMESTDLFHAHSDCAEKTIETRRRNREQY